MGLLANAHAEGILQLFFLKVRAKSLVKSEEEEAENDRALWLALGPAPQMLGIGLSGSSPSDAITTLGLVDCLCRLMTCRILPESRR